jgi:hypothetical protein
MQCNHTCTECGKQETGSWIGSCGKRLKELGYCFHCDFWLGYTRQRDNFRVARIDGVHYYVGKEENCDKRWKGFGGRRFKIRFHDGREVETDNLWCQGGIPAEFKDRLPDNAIFLEGE